MMDSSPSRRRPRSQRGQQRHQRRAVSFADTTKVLFDTSYPFLDSVPFEDRWYTEADFAALQNEAKQLARRYRSYRRGKSDVPPPTSEDDPDYCVRGMDYMISQSEFSRRKSRKEASIMSVLIEQDRRHHMAASEGSDDDDYEEALASVSRISSEAAAKEARAAALEDERAARRIQSEEKQSGNDQRRPSQQSRRTNSRLEKLEQLDSFKSASSSSRGLFKMLQRATEVVDRSSSFASSSSESCCSGSSVASDSTDPARPEGGGRRSSARRQRRSAVSQEGGAGAKNAFFKGMAQAWGAPLLPPGKDEQQQEKRTSLIRV